MEHLNFENAILEHLQSPRYVPQTAEGLIRDLNISKKHRKDFREILEKCLQEGSIVRIKRDRYCIPQDANLITGTIQFRQSGRALIFPEPKPNQPSPVPIDVLAQDTWVAMHGDTVVARTFFPKKRYFYK